jgi:hypothetical protein
MPRREYSGVTFDHRIEVAIIWTVSGWVFRQMPDDAGHEISSRKGAEKTASKAASEGTEDARGQRLVSCGVTMLRATDLPDVTAF